MLEGYCRAVPAVHQYWPLCTSPSAGLLVLCILLITSCFAPDNSRHLLALYLLYHVLFSLSAHHVLLSPCSMHVLSCYHVWMSHGRGAGEPGRDAHGCLRSESWYGSVRACAVFQILFTLILKLRVWNRNLWVHIKLSVLMFIYYRTPLHGNPLNMDTLYYRHFSLSLGKTLTFSLNPTHLIRKSVNVDNGHFSLVQSTDSYGKLTLLIRTLPCQLRSAIWERREERAFPSTDPR